MNAPSTTPRLTSSPIRIGVSSCLLGEEVRWNGGHVRQSFLVDTLGQFVEYVPVCPEVELGMGVPRPSIRLEGQGGEIRLVDPKNDVDWTPAMARFVRSRSAMVDEHGLSGFILKKDSPTCGASRVRVYGDGRPSRTGVGLFAKALADRYPFLPIEDEGRLNDPGLRENFIERVFAYRRLEDVFAGRWSYGAIVAFHTREKLLLSSRDQRLYRQLGRLVADGKRLPRAAFAAQYKEVFMENLRYTATVRRHTNVLQHAAGHFKRVVDADTRQEVSGLIDDYRRGLVPLIVPITLIRHLARRHGVAGLLDQTYLDPHPKELMLRNHA